MNKAVKQTPKENTDKTENTRPNTTKQTGYKEDVYNNEEQNVYQKSDMAKDHEKNTAAPKD